MLPHNDSGTMSVPGDQETEVRTAEERAVHGVSRVLIVDDHPIVSETLAALVERQDDFEVCGVASGATEALELIKTASPDAAIVDISLDEGDGLGLIRAARSHDRRLAILVLSSYDEAIYGQRALRAGARGYLNKKRAIDRVLAALRQTLDGGLYVSEALEARLLRATLDGQGAEDPVKCLSNRELEVFRLLGQGHAIRQIADTLHLSASTIETYCRRIRGKLDILSGRELTLHAVRWWDRPA